MSGSPLKFFNPWMTLTEPFKWFGFCFFFSKCSGMMNHSVSRRKSKKFHYWELCLSLVQGAENMPKVAFNGDANCFSFLLPSLTLRCTHFLSELWLSFHQTVESLVPVLVCCTWSTGICDHWAPPALSTLTCLEVQESALPFGSGLAISW